MDSEPDYPLLKKIGPEIITYAPGGSILGILIAYLTGLLPFIDVEYKSYMIPLTSPELLFIE
jgi:hypothetical protein